MNLDTSVSVHFYGIFMGQYNCKRLNFCKMCQQVRIMNNMLRRSATKNHVGRWSMLELFCSLCKFYVVLSLIMSASREYLSVIVTSGWLPSLLCQNLRKIVSTLLFFLLFSISARSSILQNSGRDSTVSDTMIPTDFSFSKLSSCSKH